MLLVTFWSQVAQAQVSTAQWESCTTGNFLNSFTVSSSTTKGYAANEEPFAEAIWNIPSLPNSWESPVTGRGYAFCYDSIWNSSSNFVSTTAPVETPISSWAKLAVGHTWDNLTITRIYTTNYGDSGTPNVNIVWANNNTYPLNVTLWRHKNGDPEYCANFLLEPGKTIKESVDCYTKNVIVSVAGAAPTGSITLLDASGSPLPTTTDANGNPVVTINAGTQVQIVANFAATNTAGGYMLSKTAITDSNNDSGLPSSAGVDDGGFGHAYHAAASTLTYPSFTPAVDTSCVYYAMAAEDTSLPSNNPLITCASVTLNVNPAAGSKTVNISVSAQPATNYKTWFSNSPSTTVNVIVPQP